MCGSAIEVLLFQASLFTDHGIRIQKDFHISIGEHDRSNIASFHHYAAARTHLLLTRDHPLPHFGDRSNVRHRGTDLRRANFLSRMVTLNF